MAKYSELHPSTDFYIYNCNRIQRFSRLDRAFRLQRFMDSEVILERDTKQKTSIIEMRQKCSCPTHPVRIKREPKSIRIDH